ncbi:hypothetical protein CJ030_MR1G016612 [Morella rubra]|uniref:Uncharacterized protein n=1 Tax=Morella rubra TaxID=262757 RepID=A0A6A1WJ61_9ROSI|nr:hypothetical protein CJ030_MR1G016612 [Morella rubra]
MEIRKRKSTIRKDVQIAATHSVPTECQLDWIIDVSQVREPAQQARVLHLQGPQETSQRPLHHGSEELKDMEKLKVRYFKLYCDRVLKGVQVPLIKRRKYNSRSILQEIHEEFSTHVNSEQIDFLKLAVDFLKFAGEYYISDALDNVQKSHLTDLLSASNLDAAGVEFKMGKGGLLDIEFKKGKCLEWIPCLNCSWLLACLPCCQCFPCSVSMQPFMELPRFVVDDSTETVFRNLMALEQCHYPLEAYICNYIVVLDSLINTEKDVDLLVSKNIIDNLLGSNDAVKTMINKLCVEIVDTSSRYNHLSEQLITTVTTFGIVLWQP